LIVFLSVRPSGKFEDEDGGKEEKPAFIRGVFFVSFAQFAVKLASA
jgi:hypothetical protein